MVGDTPEVPLGSEFLRLVRDQERRCVEDFDEWLPTAGIKAPETLDALGSALSYLDRIASCWWGCRKGPHIEERLIGKIRATLEQRFNFCNRVTMTRH